MANRYDNVLKHKITKEEIVESAKKGIRQAAEWTNLYAKRQDLRNNAFQFGLVSGYIYTLQTMGYAIDITTPLDADFRFTEVTEVKVDGDVIWAA